MSTICFDADQIRIHKNHTYLLHILLTETGDLSRAVSLYTICHTQNYESETVSQLLMSLQTVSEFFIQSHKL